MKLVVGPALLETSWPTDPGWCLPAHASLSPATLPLHQTGKLSEALSAPELSHLPPAAPIGVCPPEFLIARALIATPALEKLPPIQS